MDWIKKFFAKKEERIFMDFASATPVLPVVGREMVKYFSRDFYNPSAIYEEALQVRKEVEEYRSRVAKILGATPKEITFTSGGTESDNMAILGVVEESLNYTRKPHIIISSIEHPAVVKAAEEVVRRGGELSVIEVDEEGIISLESLRNNIKKNTVLISVSLANSEIGTVEPIAKIGRVVREMRKEFGGPYPLLHTDASAAVAYLPVNLETLQCDLITLDGAKIYGPKGVGILATRRGVKLHPIIFGGGQERGRRSGTITPALIAGFAKALEVVTGEREKESTRLESLRSDFVNQIIKNIPQAIINGSNNSHLPNIINVSLPGVLGEFLLLKLDRAGLMVSVGSACSYDEKVSGSPVIRALNKDELAESTVRVSFGRSTTKKDIDRAIKLFCREAKNVLELSHATI